MAARYFTSPDGAVSVYVNLTDAGAEALTDAGLTEITAEEYGQAVTVTATAAPALDAPQTSNDQTKEATASGRNKRQRGRQG
jgi:hypothetical protein